jgi:hypothetical protein
MADRLHIDRATFVGERGIARDDEKPAELRQCGCDVLDHTVGEKILLRVTTHIGEGQHRDRGLVREGERQRGGHALLRLHHRCGKPVTPPGDVLNKAAPAIFAEHAAQGRYLHGQIALLYGLPGPDPFHDRVL